MHEPTLPAGLIEARRTPLFDADSVPAALRSEHQTAVWAQLRVEAGSVRFYELAGAEPRDVRVEAGDEIVIVPMVVHQVEPSSDARFYVQFFRTGDAPMIPGDDIQPDRNRAGAWKHRGRDLDTPDEIFEMVTRQYVDIGQDELLHPYFTFGDGIDWQAHIGTVADFWCHALLGTAYEIDTIENHRHLHDQAPFTPELFDRWMNIFYDSVDGGWSGPYATAAKRRADGIAWAMAKRLLGAGVWLPESRRA